MRFVVLALLKLARTEATIAGISFSADTGTPRGIESQYAALNSV